MRASFGKKIVITKTSASLKLNVVPENTSLLGQAQTKSNISRQWGVNDLLMTCHHCHTVQQEQELSCEELAFDAVALFCFPMTTLFIENSFSEDSTTHVNISALDKETALGITTIYVKKLRRPFMVSRRSCTPWLSCIVGNTVLTHNGQFKKW